MIDQIDKEKLERAVQFSTFKNSKEWAKARKLDASMGSEMINSLYRTELQNMDKILAEQLRILMQAGNIQAVADIIAKAKGPMLKTLADVLQDTPQTSLLDPLLTKFQVADYQGRMAMLAACERIGGCSQLEALNQIELSLNSRKKKAKSDEELAKLARKVIEKIIETDDILKVVKNAIPSIEAIKSFQIEDTHTRLMQLPVDEMLYWLLAIKEDEHLMESSRSFALSHLDPPKSAKKTKLSKTLVRYCAAVLAIMGSVGKEKILVNSLCKLDSLEQQYLLQYVSEKTRDDTINKLLVSPADKADGIWHLEHDPGLVAAYMVKVFKIFEEASLPLKIRSGVLLLTAGVIPDGRIEEYVKRISLYLELSEHWEGRAEKYLQFAQGRYSYWLPALHRCNKRDLLIKDLEIINPDILPDLLAHSLAVYRHEADEVSDLIWILNKVFIGSPPTELCSLCFEAALREVKAHPNNLELLITAQINNIQYHAILAAVINEISIINHGMTRFKDSRELNNYADLTELLFTDWQKRREKLTSIPIYLARIAMANTDFRRNYLPVIEKGWVKDAAELKLQVEMLASSLENQYENNLGQIYDYQAECANSLRISLNNLRTIAEESGLSALTSINGYLDDCITISQELLDKQAKELIEDSEIPHVIIDNAAQYQAAMERLLIHCEKLESYKRLQETIGYQLMAALSLSLERVFLAIKPVAKETALSMETGFAVLLQHYNCRIIASLSAPEVLYVPDLHKSNQNLEVGLPVRVIFPGITTANGGVIRHAMVEKI